MEKNKTMLIVEDDPSTLRVFSERFAGEGYNVLQARDGEEGLKLAIENKPVVTILDILMPKMDGLEMLKNLRQNDWGKKAQVILLTNLTATEDIMKKVTQLEPSYYLIKTDWRMDDVVDRVKKVMEQ